jgi:hypothetical protein
MSKYLIHSVLKARPLIFKAYKSSTAAVRIKQTLGSNRWVTRLGLGLYLDLRVTMHQGRLYRAGKLGIRVEERPTSC